MTENNGRVKDDDEIDVAELSEEENEEKESGGRFHFLFRSRLGELLQFETSFTWMSDKLNQQPPWIFVSILIALGIVLTLIHYLLWKVP